MKAITWIFAVAWVHNKPSIEASTSHCVEERDGFITMGVGKGSSAAGVSMFLD